MIIISIVCGFCRTLFALSKKVPQMEDGIQKTYVINPGFFEFGPLICSKNRERWEADDGSKWFSVFLSVFDVVLTDSRVCVCVDTRKISIQRTQRDWLFITILSWRLRSSFVSSMIPRPPHFCWIPRPWLSNLTRNRCHNTLSVYTGLNLSSTFLMMCGQNRNIRLRMF